jgi:HlyD family secretion protein
MKRRTVVILLILLLLVGGGVGWWALHRTPPTTWRTVPVERTDVRSIVSSTGAVEAVTTVEVGTQVSGIVSELFVDFNDHVEQGQLLARIDPTLLQADVAAAEARLAASRAAEQRSRLDLTRIQGLHERAAATDQELETAQADQKVAAAETRSAEVALGRARRNLDYAAITAPIAGTVVRRDVDVGQTVNAGFSAPTLFVLVGDMHRVQVVANVDEADIGRIAEKQPVEVTVTTWPDVTFAGVVQQVRLQSELQDNVVTYPVVVSVENPDGKLLPGMTATVEFEVAEAKDVLCVPNAALRFKPESAATPGASDAATASPAGPAAAAGTAGTAASPASSGSARHGGRSRGASSLWSVDATGALVAVPVTVGLRGATCTEVSGEGVAEGFQAVVGVDRGDAEGSSSPFSSPAASGFKGGGF